MKRLLAVLVFAALVFPGLAQAQLAPNSWFVVPMVNYNVATIKDFGNTVDGLGVGLQVDRVLGGKGSVSIGITANYLDLDGNITNTVQGQTGPVEAEFVSKTQGAPIAVYGRYMFGGPGIIGFIGVGPGLMIGETTVQRENQPTQSNSSTQFAGMAMAGGMFKMGTKLYLNASVTLFMVPNAELYTDNTWAGSLGIVWPIGNP